MPQYRSRSLRTRKSGYGIWKGKVAEPYAVEIDVKK